MRGSVVVGGDGDAFDSGGVGHAAELAAEHEAETKFPWGTLLLLLRCWVAVMFLSLLKGGHGAPSVVGAACGAPCSTPWPRPTHYLLLATCCLLLAACYLLLTTGTAGYWGLVALNVPVLGYLTRLAGLWLLKRHQRLMIMGY